MANELALVDMEKVREMAERYAEFLPGTKTVPLDTRMTMAQIALAHGFDPFIGDIWPIPERKKVNGEWATSGYRIMIGITAWRRSAHDTGEYWGRHFEKATDEERKWLGAGPNDLTIKCIVYRRKTGHKPMEFDGFGIFHQGEASKMNPLQCVRLRAERDALKGAFPIGFGGGAVKIGVADDTGEEINGDVEHGPKWDVITNEPAEPTVEQAHDAPAPEPEAPRQSYRMAKVTFGAMEPGEWHIMCDRFAAEHDNWQKDGKPDMNHILASAGHAGYEFITGDNVTQMLADIVRLHNEKAQA